MIALATTLTTHLMQGHELFKRPIISTLNINRALLTEIIGALWLGQWFFAYCDTLVGSDETYAH